MRLLSTRTTPPRRRVQPILFFSIVVAVIIATMAPPAAASPQLRAIDLGTLYGRCCSHATAVNDRGEVVGSSFETDKPRHAFVWRNGQMTDLGFSWGSDINNHGDIVGTNYLGGITFHAMLWRDGRTVDLGTLGGSVSHALAINDTGEVVGASTVAGDNEMHAFSWRDGVMTDLGPVGYGVAYDINNRGQIVGNNGFLPVRWQRGTVQALTTHHGQATAINDRGQIVGSFYDGSSSHSFLWSAGRITEIVTPVEADYVDVYGINNRGDVVGGTGHGAFRWRQGQMTILPELTPGVLTTATDINNRGQIVGYSSTDFFSHHARAVLWTY